MNTTVVDRFLEYVKFDTQSDELTNLTPSTPGQMIFAQHLEKELRAMGQLVSGYLDFAERQAEREISMTMKDWAKHLDGILTTTGEKLLEGNGTVSHEQAMEKAEIEYKKYKARTLSDVESDYLNSIKMLEQKTEKK